MTNQSEPVVRDDDEVARPLLDPAGIAALRHALTDYTVDGVDDQLGLVGQAALARGDLAGAARELGTDHGPRATLVRLFLLGHEVPEADARRALPLPELVGAGVMETSGGAVRALLDIRPHAQSGGSAGQPPSPSTRGMPGPPDDRDPAADWWVVSDLGAEVQGGPLSPDHVLGIGSASLTLAGCTPRSRVDRALDIGTGCGVQALHLATHAGHVTATDVSHRALRMAATSAALSGQQWDLRAGSLLEPVAGEGFDLVVANPPFVVSAGDGGYDYRDSGLAGDDVCRRLVSGLPDVLREDGTAQLLANWVIPADGDWQDRLAGWFDGCDAWVWRRETADPGEYVSMWLRDAGEVPGSPRWTARYERWSDWFASAGVVAVGMGLITMWRTSSTTPTVVIEDVPQAVEQPAGPHIASWVGRQRRLAARDDTALLASRLVRTPDLVLERADLVGDSGWHTVTTRLRQSHAMRWQLDTDDAVTSLVAGCDGVGALRAPVELLAASLQVPADTVADAVLPVVRDLVSRGFLDFVDPA